MEHSMAREGEDGFDIDTLGTVDKDIRGAISHLIEMLYHAGGLRENTRVDNYTESQDSEAAHEQRREQRS